MYRRDDAKRIPPFGRKRPRARTPFSVSQSRAADRRRSIQIVEGLAEKYEAFHQIRYTKEALHAAVYQSNRYIHRPIFARQSD